MGSSWLCRPVPSHSSGRDLFLGLVVPVDLTSCSAESCTTSSTPTSYCVNSFLSTPHRPSSFCTFWPVWFLFVYIYIYIFQIGDRKAGDQLSVVWGEFARLRAGIIRDSFEQRFPLIFGMPLCLGHRQHNIVLPVLRSYDLVWCK